MNILTFGGRHFLGKKYCFIGRTLKISAMKKKKKKNIPDQMYIFFAIYRSIHFRFISFVGVSGVRGKEVKMSGISG